MRSIDGAVLDFKRLDLLATGETGLHRLDSRAKVLVTLAFIVTVVSFGRYELSALIPFFFFPLFMIARGNLPTLFLARKIVIVIPFVLMVGLFNPLLDREVMLHLGPVAISGGWLSWASITIRAILTVSAALILVSLSSFTSVCRAMEQLGVPHAFVLQLLFLYRYIFVLTDEMARTARARELRSCGSRGLGIGSYGPMIGHLLLRTWQRAERIHMAMLGRGFEGHFHGRHFTTFGSREFLFLFGWLLFFILLRLLNISQLLGTLVTGIAS
jgi:cobalt/nickel transport system permease protein